MATLERYQLYKQQARVLVELYLSDPSMTPASGLMIPIEKLIKWRGIMLENGVNVDYIYSISRSTALAAMFIYTGEGLVGLDFSTIVNTIIPLDEVIAAVFDHYNEGV